MIDKEILTKTFNRITEEKTDLLCTGFKDLDGILSGVEKGSLITIGARPTMGKTSFMTSILCNFLKSDKKCLLFCLELRTDQYIKRLIAQIAEIDLFRLNNNKILEEKKKDEIKTALDTISSYNLSIFDDMYEIDKIIEKIKIEKPDYVFIDYLQLLNTAEQKERSEEITDIMIELKKIAKENKCIIFILSQLSRAVESRCNKRPILLDLRESSAIADISDVVMFIYRDEYYSSMEVEAARNIGETEIIIAQNKMGATGTIILLFRSPIAKFIDPMIDETF